MLAPSRLAKIIIILIAVFVGSVFIDSWLLQPQRLEHLCGMYAPGVKIDDIHTATQKFSLQLIETPGPDNQTKVITLHGGSFGQYVCEIHHDETEVLRNTYKKIDIRN